MIRTFAGWYSILLGVGLAVLPFTWLGLHGDVSSATTVRIIGYVLAGVLLAAGGLARLARFPGRVASAYVGFGAGVTAIVMALAQLLEIGAPDWQLFAGLAALVVLIVAAWSLWPATS